MEHKKQVIEKITSSLGDLEFIADNNLSCGFWGCQDGDEIDEKLSELCRLIKNTCGDISDAVDELKSAANL